MYREITHGRETESIGPSSFRRSHPVGMPPLLPRIAPAQPIRVGLLLQDAVRAASARRLYRIRIPAFEVNDVRNWPVHPDALIEQWRLNLLSVSQRDEGD